MAESAELKRLPEFARGTRFAHFEIVNLIGAGGAAEVYRALDKHADDHVVALKVLSAEARNGPNADFIRHLFLQEAKALSRVKSPHVVQIISKGLAHVAELEVPYIAMTYLQGMDLKAHLVRKSGIGKSVIPVSEAIDILSAVAEGVHSCHAESVIHRDIKPANIFLERTPTGPKPVLLDLSVAKLVRAEDPNASLTQVVVGTRNYMAPEQALGRPATHLSDQYSLAAVLFRCLTGVSPRATDDIVRLLDEQQPQVPRQLSAVLTRALAMNPQDRFPSVFDFGAAFQPFGSRISQAMWRRFYGRPRSADVPGEHSAPTVIAPRSDDAATAVLGSSTLSLMPHVTHTTIDVHPPSMIAIEATEEKGSAWQSHELGASSVLASPSASDSSAPTPIAELSRMVLGNWHILVATIVAGLLLGIILISGDRWLKRGQLLPASKPAPTSVSTATQLPSPLAPQSNSPEKHPPFDDATSVPAHLVHPIEVPEVASSTNGKDQQRAESKRSTRRHRLKVPVPSAADRPATIERAIDGSPILPLDFK